MDLLTSKLLLIWLLVILPTCYADDDNDLKKYQKGDIDFSGKFLYEAAKNNPDVSIIFSALSILLLLAHLTHYIGCGLSLQQLLALLNLDDKSLIKQVIPKYLDTLYTQQNITFHLVQEVYGDINDEFTDSFESDLKNIFTTEMQNINLRQPCEAAYSINNWVGCQTDNMIKDLVSPDMLTCNTVVVLVDAILFKGDWLYKFDSKNTEKQNFYVGNDETTNVNMMKQTSYFMYAETNYPNAQIIQLPSKNENFSYVAWLPRDDIDDMINTLRNCLSCSINKAINSLHYSKVELSLPAFKSNITTDLNDLLEKTNVTEIFNPETAALYDMVKRYKDLFISFATQKGTFTMNEEGFNAAAANAISVETAAGPVESGQPIQFIATISVNEEGSKAAEVNGCGASTATTADSVQPVQLIADHPFVYFILYQNTPIFCGAYFGEYNESF